MDIIKSDKQKRGLHKNEEPEKSVGHRQANKHLHNGRSQRELKKGLNEYFMK